MAHNNEGIKYTKIEADLITGELNATSDFIAEQKAAISFDNKKNIVAIEGNMPVHNTNMVNIMNGQGLRLPPGIYTDPIVVNVVNSFIEFGMDTSPTVPVNNIRIISIYIEGSDIQIINMNTGEVIGTGWMGNYELDVTGLGNEVRIRIIGDVSSLIYKIPKVTNIEINDMPNLWSLRAFTSESGEEHPEFISPMIQNTTNDADLYLRSFRMTGANKITDMSYMFTECKLLEEVTITSPYVVNTSYMFTDCTILKTVPLFDTSKVTDMTGMFDGCTVLTAVPLFDTGKVTAMSNMFNECSKLITIPLLKTSAVAGMSYMFNKCTSLTSIPALNTGSVISMSNMFYQCASLEAIPLLNTSNVADMDYMFYECTSLTALPLLNTTNVTRMFYIVAECSKLASIPLLDISKVTMFDDAFVRCSKLATCKLKGLKVGLDMASSPLLTNESITHILSNVQKATGSATINITGCAGWNDLYSDHDAYIKAVTEGWTVIPTPKERYIDFTLDNTGLVSQSVLLNLDGTGIKITNVNSGVVIATESIPVALTINTTGQGNSVRLRINGAISSCIYDLPNVKDIAVTNMYSLNTIKHKSSPVDSVRQHTAIKSFSINGANSITSMRQMFHNCSVLTSLSISDASKVTNMDHMIYGCSKLTTLQLSGTSKVTSMLYMFGSCALLTGIPLLDTTNVTNMNNMFYACRSLTTIPQLNTGNVITMSNMFTGCVKLTTLPLLNTSKVTKMDQIFSGCASLTTVPLLNTVNITDMNNIFSGCSSLTSVPVLNTSNVINMSKMFYDCASLKTVPRLDSSKVTNMTYMFYGCSTLTSIPLLDTSKVTNMNNMFNVCRALTTSIPLLITSNVTDMSYMFNQCTSLTTIPLLNTSNVTNMRNMFSNCPALTTIPLLVTSNVTIMNNMFDKCTSLSTIPSLDFSKVTNMDYMFSTCTSLTTVPEFNTPKAVYIYNIFNGCSSLTTVPLLNVSSANNLINIFGGCTKLITSKVLGTKAALDISVSELMSVESVEYILNNVQDVSSAPKTIKFNANSPGYKSLKPTTPCVVNALAKGWIIDPIVSLKGYIDFKLDNTGRTDQSILIEINGTAITVMNMNNDTVISNASIPVARTIDTTGLGDNVGIRVISDNNDISTCLYDIPNLVGINISSIENLTEIRYKQFAPGTNNQYGSITSFSLSGKNNITSMENMFKGCTLLKTITTLDTSKVTNMQSMFHTCKSLVNIPLFDTSKVTNMRDMFYECASLASVPLLNTINVTKMDTMFRGCDSLTTVPLFNTSKVTVMVYMFLGCANLVSVPLFDTSKVTGFIFMFSECPKLTTVPEFDMSSAVLSNSIDNMFADCSSLTNCKLKNISAPIKFNDSPSLSRDSIFYMLNNVKTVTTYPAFNITGCTAHDDMYTDDPAVANAIAKGWQIVPLVKSREIRFTLDNTGLSSQSVLIDLIGTNITVTNKNNSTIIANGSIPTAISINTAGLGDSIVLIVEGNITSCIYSLPKVVEISITNMDNISVIKDSKSVSTSMSQANTIEVFSINGINAISNMTSMFMDCSRLSIVSINTSSVTRMDGAFSGCSLLTSVPMLDTSNVTTMNDMFNGCSKLTTIPLFDTSKVTNMGDMLNGCSKLTTVPLLNTSKVTNMGNMFNECTSLKSIPELNTANVTDMNNMFNRCSNLSTIPLLNVSSAQDMTGIFEYCTSLSRAFIKSIKTDLDLYTSDKIDVESVEYILNNVQDVSASPKTIIFDKDSPGYKSLAPESVCVLNALSKGWTIDPVITTRGYIDFTLDNTGRTSQNILIEVDGIYTTIKNMNNNTIIANDSIPISRSIDTTGLGDSVVIRVSSNDDDISMCLYDIPYLVGIDISDMEDLMEIRYKNFMSAANNQYGSITSFSLKGNHHITNMENMFKGCTLLKTIGFLNTANVTVMNNMFENCSTLTTIPAIDTSAVAVMNNMFENCSTLTTIPAIDTSDVANIDRMFYNCKVLSVVPQMDTASVTSMDSTFYNCAKLKSIPLLNTSNVTNMALMFNSCTALTSVPLLDTSNVTTMYNMFGRCSSLATIPELNVENVAEMSDMLESCNVLTSCKLKHLKAYIDFSSCKLLDFTSINYMFANVQSVTGPAMIMTNCVGMNSFYTDTPSYVNARSKGWTIVPKPKERSITFTLDNTGLSSQSVLIHLIGTDVSVTNKNNGEVISTGSIPTAISINTTGLGNSVELLIIGDVSSCVYDLPNVIGIAIKDMENLSAIRSVLSEIIAMQQSPKLRSFSLSGGNSITTMQNMFSGCSALTSVPSVGDTSKITNMAYMFYNCTSLTAIPSLKMSNVTTTEMMFNGCSGLGAIPSLDTSKVTNMYGIFGGCIGLTSIPLLDTSNVTNMGYMFYNCTSLTAIPSLKTSIVTTTEMMFSNCTKLTTIPLLDTSKVTNMYGMFSGCTTLTSVPLLNTINVSNMNAMFQSCTLLPTIPLLKTSSVTSIEMMFYGCTSLTTIPLLDINKVTNMHGTFSGCSSLNTIFSLDVSSVTDMTYTFLGCVGLSYCKLKGIKASVSFEQSPPLDFDSIDYMMANVAPAPESGTLNFTGCEGWFFEMCDTIPSYMNAISKGWNLIPSTRQGSIIFTINNEPYIGQKVYFNSIVGSNIVITNMNNGKIMGTGNGPHEFTLDYDESSTIRVKITGNVEECPYSITELIRVDIYHMTNLRSIRTYMGVDPGSGNIQYTGIRGFYVEGKTTITDMNRMFMNCTLLDILEFQDVSTAKVTNMDYMASGCTALSDLMLDTPNVTTMSNMLEGCTGLRGIVLRGTSKVTNMSNIFNGCKLLATIPKIDVQSVTNLSGAFNNCEKLMHCDLDGLKTNVSFTSCKSLQAESIDFIMAKVANAPNLGEMDFTGCVGWQEIYDNTPSYVNAKAKAWDIITSTLPIVSGIEFTLSQGDHNIEFTELVGTNVKIINMTSGKTLQDGDGPYSGYISESGIIVIKITGVVLSCVYTLPYLDELRIVNAHSLSHISEYGSLGGSMQQSTRLKYCSITGLNKIASANSMFNMCGNLSGAEINLPNCTDTSSMFMNCTTLDTAPMFNTSKVTNMQSMFSYCSRIYDAPLFNTSKVTNMQGMFYSCTSLKTIPLLNTSSVTTMEGMFESCTSLTTIPLLDTSKVTNMASMFYKCASLTTVPLFITSNVVNMYQMFNECTTLANIPLLDTSKVTNMSNMFRSCTALATIPPLDTSNVINMRRMFANDMGLKSIPLLNTSNVTDMSGMLTSCVQLATVPAFNTSKVTNMEGMLRFCIMTSIPLLDTSNVTDMSYMLNGNMMTTIPLFDTSNVTNMEGMFVSCYKLTNMPALDTSKVTNMGSMFYGCRVLPSISINTPKVVNMSKMFLNCPLIESITGLDGGRFDLSSTTVSSDMFAIPALTELKITGLRNTIYLNQTKLDRFDIVDILKNGISVAEKATIYISKAVYDEMEPEDRLIGQDKGWAVAPV